MKTKNNAGRPKVEKLTLEDLKTAIEYTNRAKYLEGLIIKLVEWREQQDPSSDDYRASKDLLNAAFDKYLSMTEQRQCPSRAGCFCDFLNKV